MKVREYLDKSEPALVRALQELVRIPTVNPPGSNYKQIVDLLAKRCSSLGMDVCVHRVPDDEVERASVSSKFPRYNLLARWQVGATSTVHFNAHYDVVPASGSWRFGSAFDPVVNNGSLYGRGSGDMKGSIAALLMALESMRRTGTDPAFNIECSFTADEETGGDLGAGHIVRSGLVEADYAVVCEGAAGSRVGCAHNGVLWLEVEIVGKSSHASNPKEGVNAFEAMASTVTHLQRFRKQLEAPRRHYIDFNGNERWPTMTMGGVFAGSEGDKINTVPGRSSFSIDRRLVPGERLAKVEKELVGALKRASERSPKARFSVETKLRIEPCSMDPQHELPQSFARAVQTIRRRPPEFRTTSGFTDLHFFIEDAGIPGVSYGVKGEHGHAVDERVGVHDAMQTARTYAEFMQHEISE